MNKILGSPVIIIGMHRSGTSMLTNFLDRYGIHMGKRVDENGEAICFQRLNEQIFKKFGAAWFSVGNLLKTGATKHQKESIELYLQLINSKKFLKSFLGNLEISDVASDYSWGWKDPRNTMLIDIITAIFPGAKIIHIYRNPIDVANSLRVRETRLISNGRLKWYYYIFRNYIQRRYYIQRAPELVDINCGIKLWYDYVAKAFKYKNNILHIRYETLLETPPDVFKSICTFLNLKVENSKISDICKLINHSRKFSFTKNKSLINVYKAMDKDNLLTELNYHNII